MGSANMDWRSLTQVNDVVFSGNCRESTAVTHIGQIIEVITHQAGDVMHTVDYSELMVAMM